MQHYFRASKAIGTGWWQEATALIGWILARYIQSMTWKGNVHCLWEQARRICTQRRFSSVYEWWYDGDNVIIVKELVHMTWVQLAQLRTTLLVENQFQVSCRHWCRGMYDIFLIFSFFVFCFKNLFWFSLVINKIVLWYSIMLIYKSSLTVHTYTHQ